jgi:hypothetical protein
MHKNEAEDSEVLNMSKGQQAQAEAAPKTRSLSWCRPVVFTVCVEWLIYGPFYVTHLELCSSPDN